MYNINIVHIDIMTIGQRITELREKNNMTATRLAILMGHENSDIIKGVESDTILPTDLQIEILAQIFKVDSNYIKNGSVIEKNKLK